MTNKIHKLFTTKPVINTKEKIMSISNYKTAGVFILPALFFGFSSTAQAVNCGDPCDATGATPQFRLIDTGNVNWDIENTGDHFRIAPAGSGSRFEIQNGADAQQLHLNANGNVGIRTGAPQSFNELEIVSNSPTAGGQADVALSPDGPTGDSGRFSVNATSNAARIGVRTGSGGYTNPFSIDLNANNDSLTIHNFGPVGIGESIANINTAAQLHVGGSGGRSGNIFIDSTGTADDWLIDPGSAGLWLRNGSTTSSPAPIKFENGAPVDSLVMASGGNIGMGTDMPTAPLHIKDTALTMLLLENTSAATGIRRVMRMSNKGAVGFEMVDRSIPSPGFDGRTYQFRTDGAGNFIINQPEFANAELQLQNDGDLFIKGTLTEGSSREIKTDIFPIKSQDFMDKLSKVEVLEWRYKSADKGDRHIGPIAEDFYKLFKLGEDDKHISPRDVASVALLAAKELQKEAASTRIKRAKEMLALKSENRLLKKQFEEKTAGLMKESDKLQKRLDSLEKLVTSLASAEEVLPFNGKKIALNK